MGDRWQDDVCAALDDVHSEVMQRIADVYDVPIWVIDPCRRVPPRGLRWTWRVGRTWRRFKRARR